MQLTGLLDALRRQPAYAGLLDTLRQAEGPAAQNVIRAARPFMLAALAHDWPGPIIYLTARVRQAYNVAEQLPVWLEGGRPVYRFAEPTAMFYDRLAWDREVIRSRIETLAALVDDENAAAPLIVTSARALMQRTLPVNSFRQATLQLRPGQRISIERLVRHLVGSGYEPASVVVEQGTFTRRGGLVDLYPLALDYPVRLDFFGDELESIRMFDPATQRSSGALDAVRIVPAREALPELMPPLAAHLAARAPGENGGLRSEAELLAAGSAFPHLEHYLPLVYPQPVTLLSYAPDSALIVLEEPDEVQETMQTLAEEAEQNRQNSAAVGQMMPGQALPYVEWDALAGDFAGRRLLELSSTEEAAGRLFAPGGRFGGQLRPLLSHIHALRGRGQRVVVVSQQAGRLAELWYEQDASAFVPIVEQVDRLPEPGEMVFAGGMLHAGWTLHAEDGDLHLLTDAEIYGWSRPEPRRRRAARRGRTPEANYSDLQEGDFVVHADYGIGRFAGTRHRTIEGTEREYFVLEYASGDTLFVPIHQTDRLTRYVGPDERPPAMTRLGRPIEWTRTREKARRAALEEARELLALYALRAAAAGHAYAPDNAWQHELEASFPYVETEDQIRAVSEVKADMESATPMDRLICGDVGYGKTEVALRAAFKAVLDGKQVAVLVPTTVLAQQHYNTFSSRLQGFPMQVEMISRFRGREHQQQIAARLRAGEVDIVIGTHRLLSADIDFKDLGLVIIDEEQRFGVKHKEHLKKLRAAVDVLTLTATPIPRTLYMSLTGVRDITMIQTPPEERLPIITHVSTFDEKLARQAILRELERGGQVFIVHNRVRTIDVVRERFARIVPEASFIVGHGQMTPRQLENVMLRFGQGEYDVLLATSIIENGIDMPNVNTLIVDRADWFGMAQLYQLRGRVGRGAQQAYAYFFHGGRGLTEEARVRLETLAEHSDLGAGFQVAMRDLELRGAGDILSTRQTGQIASVGLHLYTQLLTQSVQELKGRGEGEAAPVTARGQVVIDLPIAAYLPADWIPDMALRLQLYRRIGSLQNADEIEQMRQELQDRFGVLPVAVDGLLYQMEVKLLAEAISATAVVKPRQHILVKLPYLANVNREALAQRLGDDVEVSRTAVELLAEPDIWQWRLLDVMQQLRDGLAQREAAP